MWHDKSGEVGVLRLVFLSILLFYDERSHVVPGLLIVLGVCSIAVRELQKRLYNIRGKLKSCLSSLRPLYFTIDLSSVCITLGVYSLQRENMKYRNSSCKVPLYILVTFSLTF